MSNQHVVIVSAKRTPIGAFQGVLTPLTAVQLGSAAAKAAIAAAGIDAAELQEVIMGCVLAAGLGQAPAPQGEAGGGGGARRKTPRPFLGAEGAQGFPKGPRGDPRSHVLRRPAESLGRQA